MAIERAENPATGEEIVVVKGIVEKVFIKEIAGGTDKFGNTHRASILVGEDWVNNVNLKTREGYDPQVRFNNGTKNDPDWVTLDQGDAVRIVVTESPWTDKDGNDRVSLNSGVSKIKLVKKGSGGNKSTSSSSNGGQKQSFQKKDMSGVVAGNGFNAAKALLGTYEGGEDFVKTAISLVEIGQKIRKQLKDSRTDLDEYSIGAQSGMALIAACEVAEDISEVEGISNAILNDTLPKITEYVKEMENKTTSPAKKTVSKKTTVKKPIKKLDPEISEDTTEPEFEEDDDSIPF